MALMKAVREVGLRIVCWMVFLFAVWSPLTAQYKVGPGDLVRITVLELDDLKGSDYRIDNEGNLTLPYLGLIGVKDLSLSELRTAISEGLKKGFLKDPQVFVELTEVQYRPIRVIGAVARPGKLDRVQDINLIEAVTQAGGVTKDAGDTIIIMRRTPDGQSTSLKISYAELFIEGKAQLNIPVFPGDTINIPAETPLLISVIGEVHKPGQYQFSPRAKATILRVIAAAGGFTDFAKRGKVVVKRESKTGTADYPVNVKSIESGDSEDFALMHNDVVIVR